MSDFNVPRSRPKKYYEISETDRNPKICKSMATTEAIPPACCHKAFAKENSEGFQYRGQQRADSRRRLIGSLTDLHLQPELALIVQRAVGNDSIVSFCNPSLQVCLPP